MAVTVGITAAGTVTIVMTAEDYLAEVAKLVRKDPDQAIGIARNAGITNLPGTRSAGCAAHPSQTQMTETTATKTVETETQTVVVGTIMVMLVATTVAMDAAGTMRGGLIVVTIAVDWDLRGVRKESCMEVTRRVLALQEGRGLPGPWRRKFPSKMAER